MKHSHVKSLDFLRNSNIEYSNIEHGKLIGAKELIMLVQSNVPMLKVVGECLIAEDAIAVAPQIKDSGIVVLDLSSNNIGYKGISALAEGLEGSQITSFIYHTNNLTIVEETKISAKIKPIIKENKKRISISVSEFEAIFPKDIFQNYLNESADLKSISEANIFKAANIIEKYKAKSFAYHLHDFSTLGKKYDHMHIVKKLEKIVDKAKSIITTPIFNQEIIYNNQYHRIPNILPGLIEKDEQIAVNKVRSMGLNQYINRVIEREQEYPNQEYIIR